jgi:hypothetical protein
MQYGFGQGWILFLIGFAGGTGDELEFGLEDWLRHRQESIA